LLDIAHVLASTSGARLAGVLTHAGSSYDLSGHSALEAMAEQERAACVAAAEQLRRAGFACPVVSVGSTPTALSALSLSGVTEVRAGVYVFFDLVMRNLGVCSFGDLALSVLTTVIGHQAEKGWAIVDAGWMAMSRDRGTVAPHQDFGYGQICTAEGVPLPGYIISGTNQEHGIVSLAPPPALSGASGDVGDVDDVGVSPAWEADRDIARRFPIGTLLRVLPNHACASAAQFPEYHALLPDGTIGVWPRFYGW
jgi:D-serine deaminase-like pyridoxal phosphate-dependent protein